MPIAWLCLRARLWSYGDVRLTRLHGGALILVNWDAHKFVDHKSIILPLYFVLHLLRIEVRLEGVRRKTVFLNPTCKGRDLFIFIEEAGLWFTGIVCPETTFNSCQKYCP